MIISICPKCGETLVSYVIATFPPINVMECLHCGWRHEDKPESVNCVPFPAKEGE